MGTRSKRAPRCTVCRLHVTACVCAHLPWLQLRTRVVLVMHHQERFKTTATGPLALSCLPNSEHCLHGLPQSRLDLSRLVEPERRLLLLFPSPEARPLTEVAAEGDPRPVTLVIPDGSWNQARRIPRRVPGLSAAQRVTLPVGAQTRWGVRFEPMADGLSTFEAIARALGVLEGPAVQRRLEDVFERMVEATFAARGEPRRAGTPHGSIEDALTRPD